MDQMIPSSVLERYHGRLVQYGRDEVVFEQGETATHFFMVGHGKVKMSSFNDQGREFLKGYFSDGQSFGEPPFFNRMPYPATAIAVVDSSVWKVPHDSFIQLLRENFEYHLALTEVLCGRLVYKSVMLTEIAVEEAEHRIATLIELMKNESCSDPTQEYRVPITRQQLADMTGLRVETVIRSVKAMESRGLLRIEDGKIVWSSTQHSRRNEADW
jgi:CRP-like cAMP-binding protein